MYLPSGAVVDVQDQPKYLGTCAFIERSSGCDILTKALILLSYSTMIVDLVKSSKSSYILTNNEYYVLTVLPRKC